MWELHVMLSWSTPPVTLPRLHHHALTTNTPTVTLHPRHHKAHTTTPTVTLHPRHHKAHTTILLLPRPYNPASFTTFLRTRPHLLVQGGSITKAVNNDGVAQALYL
ncbi:hypothetical protein Pcinc_011547 [Petrolisthes cinctipes]|uniref:Uncharacterized protein n=1 Tax=Petrolisthes cinctipes TaxID=88211 RepID=A0AAE1G3F2_PETCI|nr:hypothetical protein Pcinc_011547 [Petrolisthes cinctipes]